MEEDAFKRGEYDICQKRLKMAGFSKREQEIACAALLAIKRDSIDEEEEEEEEDDTDRSAFNLMFVDNLEDSKTIGEWISCCMRKHGPKGDGSMDHKQCVAAAHTALGKSKKDADEDKEVPQIEKIGGRDLGGRSSPSTTTRHSSFGKLVKLIKTFASSKVGGMGILPFKLELPMKNLHRLQTKLERLFTLEQQFLTAEELAKRAQYAKLMKKTDAEWTEEMTKEITEDFNNVIKQYKEKFPEASDEQIEKFLFGSMSGIIQDSIWVDAEVEVGKATIGLNNIIKAPIILAKEMVQEYVFKNEDGTKRSEWHFKPYEELKSAIDGVDKLSILIEHRDEWVDEDTVGCVRQLVADDKLRAIRGMGYFVESKTPPSLLSILQAKKPFKVSIGFRARMGEAGEFNGYKYNFTQRDILLDHLAICLKSVPRCPPDQCGGNIDGAISDNYEKFTIINKDNYYYNINNLIYDSLEETKNINITQKDQGDSVMGSEISDDTGPEKPEDLNAILSRLWEFMGGHVDLDQKGKIQEILTKLGDNKLDQKEFEDAIAQKDAEIEELKKELGDRVEKILTIKKFTDSYKDDELSAMTLNQLTLLEDAVSRFNPSEKKADVIPVAGKDEKLKDEVEQDKVEREDPREMFTKINDEFELYGLR